jgi:hypothetical protein
MLLAVIGIPFIIKQKIQTLPILMYLLFNLWYITAWEIWWYGGRAMIQSYPIWAFPLASIMYYLSKHKLSKLIMYLFIIIGLFLNMWFTFNIHGSGVIDYSNMTRNYYFKTVGKFSLTGDEKKYLDVNDYYNETLKDSQLIFELKMPIDSNGNTKLYETNLFEKEELLYSTHVLPDNKFNWTKVNFEAISGNKVWDSYFMRILEMRFSYLGKKIKVNQIRPERIMNEQNYAMNHFESEFPSEQIDKIELYVIKPNIWNTTFHLKSLNLLYFSDK